METTLKSLKQHQADAKAQLDCFQELWNNPPPNCLVVGEDAGKRFVLDGKGLVHVMVSRFVDSHGEIHERHYFFCIDDSKPKVTRYTIAQSWLAFHQAGAVPEKTTTIFVFHDGGVNEHNNSSGLLLYGTLEQDWKIKFDVNVFISYHGKGLWDRLIGSGKRIMTARAILITIHSDLHYDRTFFYRVMASISRRSAECSEAYLLPVHLGKCFVWKAKTLVGISKCRRFCFELSSKTLLVHCYQLSTSKDATMIKELRLEAPKSTVKKPTPIFHPQQPVTQLFPPIKITTSPPPTRTITPPPPTRIVIPPPPTKIIIPPLESCKLQQNQELEVLLQEDYSGKEEWVCGKIMEENEDEEGCWKFVYHQNGKKYDTWRPCRHLIH